MKGAIVRAGRHWTNSNSQWACDRLPELQAEPRILAQVQGCDIRLFGEGSFSETPEGTKLWSFGLPKSEHAAALDLAMRGQLEKHAPSRWKDAFHVLLHPRETRLSIVRGEFDTTSIRWIAKRGSLFVAPALKAFSNVKAVGKIRVLDPGCSLRFDADSGDVEIIDGRSIWPRPDTRAFTFDEACEQLRCLLDRSVPEALERAPRPLAMALSGGLDSAIAAYLATKHGHRPAAYCVWFDLENGTEPVDIQKSRGLAAAFGLELREIRVGKSELEHHLTEMLYRSEGETNIVVEGSLHWQILSERISGDGFKSCLSGQGSDHLFASFPEILELREADPYDLRVENIRVVLNSDRELLVTDSYGLKTVGAFNGPETRDFSLTLPMEYLWEDLGNKVRGKRILREAYREFLPSSVTEDTKENLHLTGNLGVMLQELYGDPAERLARYRAEHQRLLHPPFLDPVSVFQRRLSGRWPGRIWGQVRPAA